jgi:hypothetical protein
MSLSSTLSMSDSVWWLQLLRLVLLVWLVMLVLLVLVMLVLVVSFVRELSLAVARVLSLLPVQSVRRRCRRGWAFEGSTMGGWISCTSLSPPLSLPLLSLPLPLPLSLPPLPLPLSLSLTPPA